MTIFWKPNGSLDVATDPCDLPQEVSGSNIFSTAMQRCKNLRLDRQGVVVTRDGSSKINSTALDRTSINTIIELNGNRYVFSEGYIFYNEIAFATNQTAAPWSGVAYNPYNSTTENVFCLNSAAAKRLVADDIYHWGIVPPATAATLAVGASTGLTGNYYVKYTYCRKEDSVIVSESNPSPASAVQALTNQSLSITWIASNDSQVTHVRVYRTAAGGSTYYHDQDVAVGTTTLDTTTADGSLGTEVATDHDRPPTGATFVAGPSYNGYLFMIVNNLLYFSKSNQPEYWPSTYYIEVAPPHETGQCLVFFNSQPYYLTKQRIYYIQGTGYNTFFPLPLDSITGAQGQYAACSVHGRGIYHVGSDGLYLWAGTDLKVSQAAFDPIFRGETVNGVPGATNLANSWLVQFHGRLYFGYTSSGYSYPSNVLVINLTNDRVSYYTWGREIRAVCVDQHNDRLLAGDTSGYVWELEDSSVTTDGGTAISWEVETKNFVLQTRANFPRSVKYDVDAASATTATGAVYLDGVLHQSHILNEDRNTRKRLVTTGNGKRMSVRISGTGPVGIYAVEAE